MHKKGVYAGSFDPPTNGHLWMIKQGAKLFDEFIVAIGINPDKDYTFSLNERLEMLGEIVKDYPGVLVDVFDNQFLVNYAQSRGAQYILRGIRNLADYEYERGMRYVNADLNSDIKTIFLIPSREFVEVSSNLVRGLVGPRGWERAVVEYVPASVYAKFLEKEHKLFDRWLALCKKLNLCGEDLIGIYKKLIRHYSESDRHYHNLLHIIRCLDEFEQVRHLVQNPNRVELALWYHDTIYSTRRKDNEEKSAELAYNDAVSWGLSEVFATRVYELIMATQHNTSPKEIDIQLMVDIDLASGLGVSEEESDRIGDNIRKEYIWVPEAEFKAKRKEILQQFLDRPQIFFADFFYKKYEEQARKNLKLAVAKLKM